MAPRMGSIRRVSQNLNELRLARGSMHPPAWDRRTGSALLMVEPTGGALPAND